MSKNDLWRLAKQIRVRAKYVTKNSDEFTRRVALAVAKELIVSTPVDTGRARSNWRTLLYKADNILFWPAPDKPASPEEGMMRALEEAEETTREYTGGRRSIWITNNVPYIRKLNDGSSAQAPKMFIELAVKRAQAEFANLRPVLTEVER